MTTDVHIERRGRAGLIRLDRQHALNALTSQMLDAIADALDAWEHNDAVERVVIHAAPGKAFSAGGDIRALYEQSVTGRFDIDFFRREYRLNERIHAYPKPYIALVDGIVMGGGVGVSFHASHVVMTERAKFAMPEVSIGFFPDVGASRILTRLQKPFGRAYGRYLGLTGTRVGADEAVACGLAHEKVGSDNLGSLLDALCESANVDEALQRHSEAHIPIEPPAFLKAFEQIDPRAIRTSLESAGADANVKRLDSGAPLPLHVASQIIERGQHLDMRACMEMEFRLVHTMLPRADFREGIRAAIIDKDNDPTWRPTMLADIMPDTVEACFADLPEGTAPLW